MNKKAFTLVELLAVVTILGIVLAIVTTSVFNILEESEESAYDNQIEMLKSSVKDYVTDNKRNLFSGVNDTICVTVADLYNNKYIDEIPVDPRKGENYKISENLGFIVTNNGSSITYDLVEDTNEVEACK